RRVGWSSATAWPGTRARRSLICRSTRCAWRSARPAADKRGCRSRASSPALRQWNSSSPWAWNRASQRRSVRSTRSWPRMSPRQPVDEVGSSAQSIRRDPISIPRKEIVSTTTTQVTTHTLDTPGATLTYDVRNKDLSTAAASTKLVLIGFPMAAAGFGTLANHFTDRTVVTYDPRGSERSVKTDPTRQATPDDHAGDLHRLIQAIGGGPVDLFATSGGAVNALALVSKHPDDVRTLVAHEPPLASILDDREHALTACRAVYESYQQRGWGAGMAHFFTVVSHRGPFTADLVSQPAPDPATFG